MTPDILPENPEKAWAEVQQMFYSFVPPRDWQTLPPKPEQIAEFQKKVREAALSYANKACDFVARFPNNENAGDARLLVVYALNHALAAGEADAERQILDYVTAVLSDKTIPENDRIGVLLYSGGAPLMKKVGTRLFTEGRDKFEEEFDAVGLETLRAALKEFPGNSMLYTFLVATAQRSKGDRQKQLATEVINDPEAPLEVKTLANHLLKGTPPYETGKPLDIRFTALDGREVDLAKHTGKVVLVEFWSTTCGPCVGEMPSVKAAYEKLHSRGFEVMGISLDSKENALRRFIKEKELPWPQYFDGKGLANRLAVQYGIFSIPTMWLVDKRGNLRVTDARSGLERLVSRLLDEPTPAASK